MKSISTTIRHVQFAGITYLNKRGFC